MWAKPCLSPKGFETLGQFGSNVWTISSISVSQKFGPDTENLDDLSSNIHELMSRSF